MWDIWLKFLFEIYFSANKFRQGISKLIPTLNQQSVEDAAQTTLAPSNSATNESYDRPSFQNNQPVVENSEKDKEGKHNGLLLYYYYYYYYYYYSSWYQKSSNSFKSYPYILAVPIGNMKQILNILYVGQIW